MNHGRVETQQQSTIDIHIYEVPPPNKSIIRRICVDVTNQPVRTERRNINKYHPSYMFFSQQSTSDNGGEKKHQ